MNEPNDDQAQPTAGARGIFDGFESFRLPSEADHQAVLNHGLVAPDTNVLLNLYRYSAASRDKVLAIFEGLGDRLWVPHQVLDEFWHRRVSTIADPVSFARETKEILDRKRSEACKTLSTWAERFALPPEEHSRIVDLMSDGFAAVIREIDTLVATHAGRAETDTSQDPVVKELERILIGRVGAPFALADHEQAVAEGIARWSGNRPPGYRDKKKSGDSRAGDYLVWEQVLREASTRKCDVLLVTGDSKEDWWRKQGSTAQAPRQELIEELAQRAGTRLFMMAPEPFINISARILGLEVPDGLLEDVARVDRLREDEESNEEPDLGDSADWDATGIAALVGELRQNYLDRVAVLRWAADNNGFIGRDAIRELCSYRPEDKLNTLTRPINRITGLLKAQGVIAPDTAQVLCAEYDPSYSYVTASGFRLHSSAIPLLRDLPDDE